MILAGIFISVLSRPFTPRTVFFVISVAPYAGHGVSFLNALRERAWLAAAVSRDVFRYDLHARESLFLNVHKIRVDSDNKW